MNTLFELLTYIRTELLEKVFIPGLGVSYWHFLIYLAVASVVVTVLVNGVRLGRRSDDADPVKRDQEKMLNNSALMSGYESGGKPKPDWMK